MQPLSALDFWLGRWDVRGHDGELAGTNLIERALDGHAILEHWRGAAGHEGKSLFYFHEGAWHQLWVMPGHMKQKTLVECEPTRLLFEGFVEFDGGRLPDRTTLTALADGSVRQVIEQSHDGGLTWQASFDAIYVRTA